jgi:8-oxo-dGTP diphosphatase
MPFQPRGGSILRQLGKELELGVSVRIWWVLMMDMNGGRDEMYIEQLPKKRMAAGALLRNLLGQLLLVKPTYRPEWLLPGGAVELNESPRSGCVREVHEELGLWLPLQGLLCVDYRPADNEKSEAVHFVFDGGILTEELVNHIRLPQSELEAFTLLAPDDALQLLDVHSARRIAHALVALSNGTTIYLEDGCISR